MRIKLLTDKILFRPLERKNKIRDMYEVTTVGTTNSKSSFPITWDLNKLFVLILLCKFWFVSMSAFLHFIVSVNAVTIENDQ